MYCEHFGLSEKPFSLAPDPRYVYMSRQHWEAMAHLHYGLDDDWGFVLITGDVGTGKTTLCRLMLEQLPENTDVAFIINPMLDVRELLATICDEFGIPYGEDNPSTKVFINHISEYLLDNHAKARKAVLIIDEAQYLDFAVLDQLRLLTNLETNQCKLLRIILIGQPELREKLGDPALMNLSQRITARYHLGPLSKEEVAGYVNHRLTIAGAARELFSASTVNSLSRLSGGIPRLINVIGDRALLGACIRKEHRVSRATLTDSAHEVFRDSGIKGKNSSGPRFWLRMAVFPAMALVVALLWIGISRHSEIRTAGSGMALPGGEHRSTASASSSGMSGNKVQWPDARTEDQTKAMAYQALIRQWGFVYRTINDVTFCSDVQLLDLHCLHAKGSLRDLKNLNRPVILKLLDSKGTDFYVTLIALEDKNAHLLLGGEPFSVEIMDLLSQWSGDFTMLWRIPPDYEREIRAGDRGPVVRWLEEKLAAAQGRSVRVNEDPVFDAALLNDVRKFQRASGLMPDGIVGPMTLIRLSLAANSKDPVLTGTNEGT